MEEFEILFVNTETNEKCFIIHDVHRYLKTMMDSARSRV